MHLTSSTEELSAWIRLSLEPGLGPAQARSLLAAIGLPQDIYALPAAALSKYLPVELARQLRQAASDHVQAAINDTLQWLQHPGHHLITLADPVYPRMLLDIHDPPLLLYANGSLAHLGKPIISIVGARSASAGGTDNARAFARHLAEQGWCIASGLALGVDSAAHEGALMAGPAGGSTIAIMATGIDIVYPARNRDLAHRIAQEGVLLSEFPLGTRALPYQFPKRNRLVAGIARGVLVVEAAKQSGSLITARLASEMGREVFAIPGSIHSPLSRGCHALIRQGAKLVESAEDIREELGISGAPLAPVAAKGRPARKQQGVSDSISQLVLEALGYDPVPLDTLQQRSQLDVPQLTARLLELELQEIVVRLEDGRFQRR
ncbi:DNA-protecting protein DprA [Candidimonas sp. SYP-B2681]|uniref:DNA-processing protein DprA n=1 Tax=Candidimonas sp. SYP-B2681 TaxID=2497686 RepID=UPI000F863040|nr:DNA-processing protein DprA [Candidimonas sp. SYP-B2681]RTZ45855.1 DNA-protecting protein DprA [Candidimonas sp. SYP-B2681]